MLAESCQLICGIDEAGRGPLIGNVVAGAVILDDKKPIFGLQDSKKLSAAKRNQLYELIIQNSLAWGVGHHVGHATGLRSSDEAISDEAKSGFSRRESLPRYSCSIAGNYSWRCLNTGYFCGLDSC